MKVDYLHSNQNKHGATYLSRRAGKVKKRRWRWGQREIRCAVSCSHRPFRRQFAVFPKTRKRRPESLQKTISVHLEGYGCQRVSLTLSFDTPTGPLDLCGWR